MSAELSSSAGSTRAYFMLVVTTLCWGANAIFGRLAVGELSPMLLVSLRWLGVVLLLLVFARKRIRNDWPVLRRHLVFIAAMGALGFAGFNALFYVAAHTTTAVNIGIFQGSIPVFVFIGGFFIHHTQVSRLQIAGVALTLIGVVIVASAGSFERLATLVFNRGDILMLIACSIYAGYALALRNRPPVAALSLFAAMAAAAFITSIPFVLTEIAVDQFQMPSAKGWLIAGLVALLPSFLAQIFFIKSVELIGPGRAGIFANLVPVFASVFAVVFLSEPFELFHAVALSLVLAGIWLSERGKIV